MTQSLESRGVDTDRIDTGGSRPWRAALAALIIGAVIGAAVGLLYGISQPRTATARTAISVLPDSTVDAQSAGAPDQDATSFIQAQLVVLNGDQLAATVQQQLRLAARPDVSSSQVGQTYVVQTTATAPTSAQALAEATATGQAYAALRTQQLGSAIDGRIQQVNTQLQTVQNSLNEATAASPTSITPAESALQTQYQQLLQSASALQVSRAQVASVVTVLSPAAVVAAGGLSGTTGGIVIGAVVGAVVGLLLLLVGRRFSPRVRTVGDLTALGVPVLLPVLPASSHRVRGRNRWRSSAARLLAARLTGGEDRTPLVVVGATPGVGTSHVATSIAAAMVERGPVLLVLATGLVNGAAPRSRRHESEHVAGTASLDQAGSAAVEIRTSDDISSNAVPSEIPGVWVLPCDNDALRASLSLPSSRTRVLADLISRAARAGWQVVVDAPALSESDLAVAVSTGPVTTVLIVARGTSRPADVVSAADLFESLGRTFAGTILNAAPRRLRRRRRPVVDQVVPVPPTADTSDVHDEDGFFAGSGASTSGSNGTMTGADFPRRGRRRPVPAGSPTRANHAAATRRPGGSASTVASSNSRDSQHS